MVAKQQQATALALAAEKRWAIDVAVAFAVYSVLVIGAPLVVEQQWPAVVRGALALAPMVPILYFVRALVAFYRSRDELQRRKMAEAAIVSVLVVGLSTFAWGWLALASLLPPLHSVWTLPALLAVYGVASFFVERRYR